MDKKPRKPIQRKTWMKRTPFRNRTKRMNVLSPKQRKILEGIRDARAAYRELFRYCVLHPGVQSTVHEISSGTAGRPKGIVEPATWLPLCYQCNCDEFTDKKKWPVQRQLCLKKHVDPTRYDLAKFNECYTHGTVYQEDVDAWDDDIRELLGLN